MTGEWRRADGVELSPILVAAREVFFERGFHGASVREIAARAGLTVPSLYYHHSSKDGLLGAVLMGSLGQIADDVELAADEGSTPTEQLANAVECIVLAMTVDARVTAIDAAESRYLAPESHAAYVAVRDRLESRVQRILADGAATGEFQIEDPDETRRAILGMTQAIPRWYHSEGRDTPADIAARYVRLVLRMVGARPPLTIPEKEQP